MSSSQGQRAAWNHEQRKIVVDLFVEEVRNGNRPTLNLKRSCWGRIKEGYFRKTGIRYDHKQFKNLWDSLRKRYYAWVKLVGQTGVVYDENTRMIIMEPKLWDEYLEDNPDAKYFRTRPIQFLDEMKILFAEASTSVPLGKGPYDVIPLNCYASSSQSIQGSQLVHDIDSPNTIPSIPNTPIHIVPEDDDDGEHDENMANLNRKRKKPVHDCQTNRDSKGAEVRSDLDRLVGAMDRVAPTGPTIEECIDSLNDMEEIPKRDPLYMVAVKSFTTKEYRHVWMALGDAQLRLDWLKSIRGQR